MCIENYNLFLHNWDTKSYFESRSNSEFNIDFFLSSYHIVDKISIKVFDETLGSDLYPIEISLSVDRNVYMKRSFNLKSKKTDWSGFRDHLDSNYHRFLGNYFIQASICSKYVLFITIIIDALIASTPAKSVFKTFSHRNPVPWWDLEGERSRRLRSAAF